LGSWPGKSPWILRNAPLHAHIAKAKVGEFDDALAKK
jgi:hypothetical protein